MFGPFCRCSHLAFAHIGGKGACTAGKRRCACKEASAIDTRWADR